MMILAFEINIHMVAQNCDCARLYPLQTNQPVKQGLRNPTLSVIALQPRPEICLANVP